MDGTQQWRWMVQMISFEGVVKCKMNQNISKSYLVSKVVKMCQISTSETIPKKNMGSFQFSLNCPPPRTPIRDKWQDGRAVSPPSLDNLRHQALLRCIPPTKCPTSDHTWSPWTHSKIPWKSKKKVKEMWVGKTKRAWK